MTQSDIGKQIVELGKEIGGAAQGGQEISCMLLLLDETGTTVVVAGSIDNLLSMISNAAFSNEEIMQMLRSVTMTYEHLKAN